MAWGRCCERCYKTGIEREWQGGDETRSFQLGLQKASEVRERKARRFSWSRPATNDRAMTCVTSDLSDLCGGHVAFASSWPVAPRNAGRTGHMVTQVRAVTGGLALPNEPQGGQPKHSVTCAQFKVMNANKPMRVPRDRAGAALPQHRPTTGA